MSPRDALREAVAAEHKLHLQLRELEENAVRWQRRATLAADQKEPELAQQALARAAALEERAASLRRLSAEHAALIRATKAQLRATSAAVSSPADAEARLQAMELEDRLERDLATLKALLS